MREIETIYDMYYMYIYNIVCIYTLYNVHFVGVNMHMCITTI